MPLHWKILLAIILAGLAGLLIPADASIAGLQLTEVYSFIGTLFLNALKMLVIPLVVSSIICGIANIGSADNLGRMGLKTLGFYLLSSFLAILIGLLLVNLMTPGLINGEAAGEQLNLSHSADVQDKLKEVEGRGSGDIAAIFLRMVPSNVVAAAAEGQMLGLISFSLLFGFFMTRLPDRKEEQSPKDGLLPAKSTLMGFWQAVSDVMMDMTMFIMRFAPLGVFGLVAATVANTGFAAFQPLLIFFTCVLLALFIHIFGTLSVLLIALGRLNPLAHLKAMSPALLTAFSTASSSGTLALTMECVEKNAGVSNRTASFVLPLGATVNMDGTALYECVAAMFIAQAYGLDLSIGTQLSIVIVALLTSIGVAGIPSASLVAITVILGVIGLPLEGIGLLMVTDRVLDMLRTSVNVYSDSCCAVIVAKTEGEEGILAIRR